MLVEAPDNVFWCSFILPDFLSSFLLSYTVYLNVAAGQDFTVIKHWTANGRHLSRLAALSSCWTKSAHIIYNLFQCHLTLNLVQIILKISLLFFSKYSKSHTVTYLENTSTGGKKNTSKRHPHFIPDLLRATNNFQSVSRWKPDQNLKHIRSPQCYTNMPHRSAVVSYWIKIKPTVV